MDPDELQSDLLALRRLYGLLINDKQYGEDECFENLDKNARQLLLNLLNVAADKALEAHSKMLGAQYKTSYDPWSMPQEQSSDGLNLQPFSPSNAPTDFPSLQQVDYLTGESIFNDPTNQTVFPRQTNSIDVSLKRCRVCQKPKVKQLTKEMSIQDRNVLTLKNISQQQVHNRSWEVQNDPSRVEDSALTFNYVKSLALINLTDEEDQISREASTKILQIESCISSLQVAVKRVNLVELDFENQPSQMGPTVTGQTGSFVVERSDPTKSKTGRRTWNPANELTLQSQPFDTRTVYTMSPGSQTSQAAENVGLRNQHNYMPKETYDYFHSGVTTLNSNRPLYREQMDKKEVMGSEIMEWLNPTDRMTAHGRHEYQEAEFKREKRAGKMYKDQINDYKEIHRKHEIVKPISMVSPSSQSLSDSPISSSISDTISQSESQQGSSSSSDSEGSSGEVYSGSSDSESVMYSLSSQDHSPDMSSSTDSSESEPKLRKAVPKKGQKSGIKKELSMSSSSETSGSKSKAKPNSWLTIFTKGNKHGNKNAPKSSPSESSESESKLKPKSKETVPTKGHKGGNRKEPERSSSESSESESKSKSNRKSKEIIPTKGHKGGNRKEPESSSSESSGSESKSKSNRKSKEIIPTKVHKGGNTRELKSSSSKSLGAESNSKPKSLEIVPITGHKRGTSQSSVSKSKSKKTIPTKDHQKDSKTERKMSSSSESSGSESKKTVQAKNHKSETKKEHKKKQVGGLAKLKDKLAIILHQHHHHHHHHHHHPNDEDLQQDPVDNDHHKHPDVKDHHHHSDDKDHHKHPDDKDHHHHSDDKDHHKHPDDKEHHHHSDNTSHHKTSIWKKAFGHKKQKDEAYGEQAVNKVHSKAIVVHKLGDKKQKGHLSTLVGGVGGLIKHASHAKKSKNSKSVLTKIPSRKSGKNGGGKVGKKMQWWDMLQRQRKIKRVEKLRGKIAK